MSLVHLHQLIKSFRGQLVLDQFDLEVESGSYLVLLGQVDAEKQRHFA